jgi:hypothetical protein
MGILGFISWVWVQNGRGKKEIDWGWMRKGSMRPSMEGSDE